MPLHTNRKLLLCLLIIFSISFSALGILSLIEAQSPFAHFWNLMLHDRIFQVVMLDFTFFFVWVFFWMIDRARMNGRNPYPWLLVGMCVATLMIYLYILTERRGSTQSSSIR